MDNDNKTNIIDSNIPAYIRLKFNSYCKACNEIIKAGDLAFWHKETKGCFHGACGNPKWKEIGTPYYIRKRIAIDHNKIALDMKSKIKLALRRFRKELTIHVKDLNLEPEVYNYLKSHKLVEQDNYCKDVIRRGNDVEYVYNDLDTYSITPRGFNWDVDQVRVRMPESDEDIMERDADVAPNTESP